MKTLSIFIMGLLMLIGVSSVRAQSYSIDWSKIAGGGATSTGGVYQVSATVGQHDAGGPFTGGGYSLTGGFWSLIAAVQTPGAPTLRILFTSTNTVIVSWPSPSTGFVLQENNALGTTNWTDVGPTPTDDGTSKAMTIPVTLGNKFFRLRDQQ